jgi:hypothetical protein
MGFCWRGCWNRVSITFCASYTQRLSSAVVCVQPRLHSPTCTVRRDRSCERTFPWIEKDTWSCHACQPHDLHLTHNISRTLKILHLSSSYLIPSHVLSRQLPASIATGDPSHQPDEGRSLHKSPVRAMASCNATTASTRLGLPIRERCDLRDPAKGPPGRRRERWTILHVLFPRALKSDRCPAVLASWVVRVFPNDC